MNIASGSQAAEGLYSAALMLSSPELIVTIFALITLFVDLAFMREETTQNRRLIAALISGIGCVASTAWMLVVRPEGQLAGGMLAVDGMAIVLKVAILVLSLLTILISTEPEFTEHVGEYFALILFATVGMMLMVGAENLLMLFIALELASLCLYILTGFNKWSAQSAEAALKYFLFGSTAAAFALFGLSLVFGATGTTQFRLIATSLANQPPSGLFIAGMIMVVVGLGFKVAVVPFHLWTPDAYQGAPTPSAALIASGSKVASFFLLARLMVLGFDGFEGSGAWQKMASGWIPLLALLATLSMIVGNLVALAQQNLKRLLAYSAIAHSGYAVIGIMANSQQGISSLVYYVVTYAVAALGAFGVISAIESSSRRNIHLSDLAGLSKRAPGLSLCMLVFILSLAGIPPLAGFIGKFSVFVAVLREASGGLGYLWIVVLAIAFSALSLYYYLQVLKQIYVFQPLSGVQPIRVGLPAMIAIVAAAVLVILLGCAPGLLMDHLGATLAIGNIG